MVRLSQTESPASRRDKQEDHPRPAGPLLLRKESREICTIALMQMLQAAIQVGGLKGWFSVLGSGKEKKGKA